MRTRIIVRGLAALTAVWLAGGWALHGQERAAITKAQVDQWMQELSNWGRWGADDQLGAVQTVVEIGEHPASSCHLQHDRAKLLLARGVLCRGGRAFQAA